MTLPAIMGCDGAGVVDQLGEGVTGVNVGDKVVLYPAPNWGPNREAPGADFGLLGMPFPGTIAESVCLPADNLAPKPAFTSWEAADALPLTAPTSCRAPLVQGNMQAGHTLPPPPHG